MSGAPPSNCSNLLLNALALNDYAAIEPLLERTELNEGDLLARQGDPIAFVCFPEAGVTSLADVLPDGSRVDVALIGREGMTNAQIFLGCEQAPHEASVEIGGGASLRIWAEDLKSFCSRNPSATSVFLRFIHTLSLQTSRTLASNLHLSVEKRLSRWLLMCHDRVEGDEIRVFHQHLGRMLGVRRASVTNALHALEGMGALKSCRGRIVMRDRLQLEEMAGDFYGFAETKYNELIGPFGKGRRVQHDLRSELQTQADPALS